MIEIEKLIRSTPKVELHVQLEGAVRPATLLRLADRNGVSLPGDTEAALAKWTRYRSYAHLLEVGLTVNSCIRTAEDVEEVARDFLVAQWEERVAYSEVSYTPHTMSLAGDEDFHRQIDGVNRARSWAARELGVGMGLVIQLPRRARLEDAMAIVRRAGGRVGDGVVAVGFSGNDGTCAELGDALALAREKELAIVLDVEQIAEAETLKRIVECADPDRLINPICATDDEGLRSLICDGELSIVVCPTAAVTLGSASSLENIGISTLLDWGTQVSLSTHSPCLLGVNLAAEHLSVYRDCCHDGEWSFERIADLVRNAVDGSFLAPHDKKELRRRFEVRLDELLGDEGIRVCSRREADRRSPLH